MSALPNADPLAVTAALAAAEEGRRSLPPFTDALALGEEAAYEVQRLSIARRVARGERAIGAKLGLTSRAKQRTMQVDQPLYGWLTDAMHLPLGEPVPVDALIHPRVEPEIAFLLGSELRGPATVADVLAATEGVCVAIEVIDSRYAGFRFRLPDVVADNASAAAFVLGGLLRAPSQLPDMRTLGVVLTRSGEVVATAAGAAVLGHPAAAVAWLATRLAARGEALPAGSLVLSGALTDAFPIAPGVTVCAEVEGLGAVEVRA